MAGTGIHSESMRQSPAGGDAPAQSAGAEISPAEFASLFTQSFRVLWYIALGLVHDRNLAEDVVQEAAIIALAKLDRFQRGTNFVAWMAQTVRYAALNLSRRNRRHASSATDPSLIDAAAGMAAPQVETTPLRLTTDARLPERQDAFDDRLVRALGSINETARACLLLRTIEQMEYREIARILDIAEGTAMSHVHRARAALRERLAPMAPPASNASGREAAQ